MSASEQPSFPALVGGRPCLDFANTVGPRLPAAGTRPDDRLPGYPELVAWAVYASLLTPGQARHLTALAREDRERAAEVHRRAIELREAMYRTFSAVADGTAMPSEALDVIQDAYVEALRAARLGPAAGGLDWVWPDRGPLEQVLWPLARSAVDLAVSSGLLARIKRCPGDDGQCAWLFVDTSKNATRRWCSMSSCGSRVKSRRQAERLRAARTDR